MPRRRGSHRSSRLRAPQVKMAPRSMSSTKPDPQAPEKGTLQVTADLLRRFLPGDVGRVASGLGLLLGASGVGLLQPWPLKLVLDCVLGTREPPAALAALLRN